MQRGSRLTSFILKNAESALFTMSSLSFPSQKLVIKFVIPKIGNAIFHSRSQSPKAIHAHPCLKLGREASYPE